MSVRVDIDDYQVLAHQSHYYPVPKSRLTNMMYPVLGMCSEAGEVANEVKHIVRRRLMLNQEYTPLPLDIEERERLVAELGDVLWYLSEVCTTFDIPLSHVAYANLAKVAKVKNDAESGRDTQTTFDDIWGFNERSSEPRTDMDRDDSTAVRHNVAGTITSPLGSVDAGSDKDDPGSDAVVE